MAAHRIQQEPELQHIPLCPLCHRADQVQKMQKASERGKLQMQMPPMSRQTKRSWIWIIVATIVYGGANFYLFAQLGGGPGFGSWPLSFQILEVVIVEAILLVGLALSILSFARFINERQETVWRRPVQEEDGRGLYYCLRDQIMFDAQQQRVLSQEEMQRHLRVLPPEPGHPTVEERD